MAMNHTVNFALGLLVAMPMFGCKYLMKESFLDQKLKYIPNLLVEFFKKKNPKLILKFNPSWKFFW